MTLYEAYTHAQVPCMMDLRLQYKGKGKVKDSTKWQTTLQVDSSFCTTSNPPGTDQMVHSLYTTLQGLLCK